MAQEVETLYFNLNNLLQDICKFLTEEKISALTIDDKKIAETLIARSKKQLEEISKLTPPLNNDEDYVDMGGNTVVTQGEETTTTNSSTDMSISSNEITLEEDSHECPYKDLPASESIKNIKHGYLFKMRRFVVNIKKRVYVVIHNSWLLLYGSEKDNKPIETFNLKHYEAIVINEIRNSKNFIFELKSDIIENKTIQFITSDYTDLHQWVSKINEFHNNLQPEIVNNTTSEYYDTFEPITPNNNEEDEEQIYQKLFVIRDNRRSSPISSPLKLKEERPPLPERPAYLGKFIPTPIVPTLPFQKNNFDDESSLATYEAIICDPTRKEHYNRNLKHNDEDDDATYEALVITPQNVPTPQQIAKNNNLSPEKKERPKIPMKPPSLKKMLRLEISN